MNPGNLKMGAECTTEGPPMAPTPNTADGWLVFYLVVSTAGLFGHPQGVTP